MHVSPPLADCRIRANRMSSKKKANLKSRSWLRRRSADTSCCQDQVKGVDPRQERKSGKSARVRGVGRKVHPYRDFPGPGIGVRRPDSCRATRNLRDAE